MNENWDFIEQLTESFLKHLEHILHCPLCANRLSKLLREAQDHEPEICKLKKDE